MAKGEDITTRYKLDISDLKKNISEANNYIKLANSEFKKASSGMDDWTKSTDGLSAKLKQLKSTMEAQVSKLQSYQTQLQTAQKYEKQSASEIENLKKKLEDAKRAYGENSDEVRNLQSQLSSAEQAHSSIKQQISNLTVTINNQEAAVNKIEKEYSNYSTQLQNLQKAEERANSSTSKLSDTIDDQQKAVDDTKEAYKNALLQYGKNSSEAKNLAKEIKTLSGDLNDNKTKMQELDSAADKLDKSIDSAGKSADDASNGGFTVLKGALANLAADAVEGCINGILKLGGALLNAGKQAIASYSDYEQLVGGVETLFKDSSGIVENYANNAYKTAGLSANEYMDTVTSFSASLLQSLNGDTAKSAEVADKAITDMSDNANKMGTSMESIQNAYQGFAKQNYTMLDNLKLGYGGTKSEMERLIGDANKLAKAQGQAGNLTIESYADVVEAIHLVQDNMGITGTTAKEASTTVIQDAFNHGVNIIMAECDPDNENSWHLLESLGMKRVQYLQANVYFFKDENGNPIWKDTFVYELRKQ